jgi:hypothetical protein
MSKEDERLAGTAETLIHLAGIRLLARLTQAEQYSLLEHVLRC